MGMTTADLTWTAPTASGPVSARIRLPASKSITNRALVLAALSDSPALIVDPLLARDTALAAGGLRGLGAQIARKDKSKTLIAERPGVLPPGNPRRARW